MAITIGELELNRLRRVRSWRGTAGSMLLSLLVVPGWTEAGASPAASDYPNVSTLAGSGAVGIVDGPGHAASFVSPVALTFADDGTLYVADRDAQRIRSVARDGSVRTVAGSGSLTDLGIAVPGGFHDGPALEAQFSMPQAVLAMPDGSLLVADTGNFCLRSIRANQVTTFVGDHKQYGGNDGARKIARFRNPRSLALGADGIVYVADWQNGVRRIDKAGNVTTLQFPDSADTVAVAVPPKSSTTLFAATSERIDVLDIPTLKIVATVPLGSDFSRVAAREGGRTIGPVAAIAPYDAARFLTVDALDSAVRYVGIDLATRSTYTRTLSASPDENAAFGSAGFADGPGNVAMFDQPLGVALAADGRIAVADVGNRRIRLLGPFEKRTHVDVDLGRSELPTGPDARIIRVALVGNSEIWFDQAWHSSVPGIVEDRIEPLVTKKGVLIYPVMRFGLPPVAGLELIDETLSTGVVDAVVFDVSTYGEIVSESDAAASFGPGFEDALQRSLTAVSTHLKAAGIPFLVVFHPGPADLPDEFEYRRAMKGDPATGGGDTLPIRDAIPVQMFHDRLQKAVVNSGVESLDLWPAFLQAYGATDRKPLFEAWDHHLSPAGRRLVGEAIAVRLAPMLADKASRP